MKELISIIVPVYNVEKYLDKCIESIINQTYKKIEILLVDDESPDNCPKICDEWAKRDNRIKVIHKKNGGLSDARNYGIRKATGDFYAFVDSDDYIEEDMIEVLYSDLKKYKTDISICAYYDEYEYERKISKHFDNKITVLNKMEALENLIIEKNLTNHSWNKLYKSSLFRNIEFPVGQKLEDISTTYKLFERTNRIVFDNYVGYHYIQRSDGIMGNINKKLIEDYEKSVFNKNKDIYSRYPELINAIKIENIKTYKLLHYLAILGGVNDLLKSEKYKNYYKNYKTEYLKYRKQIKEIVGEKTIISYDLFWFSKKIYCFYVKHK